MFKATGKQATKQPNFFFDTCSRRGGPRKRGMETQTSQVAKGEYVCMYVCINVSQNGLPCEAMSVVMGCHEPIWVNVGYHGLMLANMGYHGPTLSNMGEQVLHNLIGQYG